MKDVQATFASIVKKDDEPKTFDITPGLDADLKVTVNPNKTYFFQLIIFVMADSSVPDFKFDIQLPTGFTDFRRLADLWTGATLNIVSTAPGTFNLDASGGEQTLTTYGTFSTPATIDKLFGLSWSQRISSGDATTVRKGSILLVWESRP